MNAKTKKTKVARRGKTRHGKYKVGTCKLTVTVENEVKVRVDRYAATHDYADASAFLRELIHDAVWDEPLLDEDYDRIKAMRKEQEAM